MDGTATLTPPVDQPAATPKSRRRPTTPKPPKPKCSPPPAAPKRPERARKGYADVMERLDAAAPWVAAQDPFAPPHWSHHADPPGLEPLVEPEPNAQSEPEPAPRKPLTQSEAIQELTRRANAGSQSALDALRKLLDQHPEMLQSVGDLGKFAERAWIDLVAGGNKLVEEATTRRLNELKAQLAGSYPTTLEALVSDLVAINWLAVQEANIAAASAPGNNLPLATYRLRRAESAQRRFASATRSLATLRALLPADQPIAKAKPEGQRR